MPVNFDTLYDLYDAKKLVFILGSELLRLKTGDLTFEQKVIERVSKKKFDKETSPRSLVDLAIKYADDVSEGIVLGIYNRVKTDGFNNKLLELVADFPKIDLFISTTFDGELASLLGEGTEEIIWNHQAKAPLYLDLENQKKKLVYLFGKFDNGVSFFEEEQLESLLSLSSYNEKNPSSTRARYSFLEYLRDKTLVFIGVNASDWFLRFLIRTLYNTPVTPKSNKAYIINDKTSGINFERYFFEKFKIELIHDFPIEEWLNNLHDNIREKESFDNRYRPKRVFISYDRNDIGTARDLKNCLNLKHIEAFLDTEDMGIAEHERKIRTLIQSTDTCVFVCILSGVLAAKSKENSYVKRIEWKIAGDRYHANSYLESIGQAPSPFITTSYAIDDFNSYKNNLEEFILANNIFPASSTTIDHFCDVLEEIIKSIKL